MDYKTKITNQGDDICYVNIVALNTSEKNQRANIDISRTAPILTDTGDYLLSIVKFRIPTNLFPIVFFPTYPLTVSIQYQGFTYSQNLIYTPTNFTEMDLIYPGGIYSYQSFADMVNNAITACYNLIPLPPIPQVPFMVYNTVYKRFQMYFPSIWADIYPFNNPIIPHMFFNTDLNWYFQSFPTISRDNQTPLDQQIIVDDLNNTNKVPFPPNTSLASYLVSQEYDSLALVNSLTNISITSNNIPVNNVNIATTTLGTGSSSSKTLSIIEDFDPFNDAGSQRSVQEYTATTLRYSSLYQKATIYNINLGFYIYSQERDVYVPIFIPPKFTLSIKLQFKRRSLNY